jgi:GNAT superfamily N-acetyltransferase
VAFELVPARPEHVSELGRILYEAFKDIADRHHFPPFFPNASVARQVVAGLVDRDDVYAVAAVVDGQPVGSNYLESTDEVAGVQVISVEVGHQGEGIGRALMQDVLDRSREKAFDTVRLLHESHNVASLSLYASLGFDTKEAVAFMTAAPSTTADDTIRPITEDALPTIKRLSIQNYRVSRCNEVAGFIRRGDPALLRERDGSVTGYFVPGLNGHGVAMSKEDALALITEAARRFPDYDTRFFCPLSLGDLYRDALRTGCRPIEVMNLMAMGKYESPSGIWMPSVTY